MDTPDIDPTENSRTLVETLGKTGATVHLRETRKEKNGVQNIAALKIDAITLGNIKITPYKPENMEELVDLVKRDEAGFRDLYSIIQLPEDREEFIAKARRIFNFAAKNLDFYTISLDDKIAGHMQVAKVEDDQIRIAPYINADFRGQHLMKPCYLAVAETYASYFNRNINEAFTLETNTAMQNILQTAGLKKLNEAPCSSIAYKAKCAIYERPLN